MFMWGACNIFKQTELTEHHSPIPLILLCRCSFVKFKKKKIYFLLNCLSFALSIYALLLFPPDSGSLVLVSQRCWNNSVRRRNERRQGGQTCQAAGRVYGVRQTVLKKKKNTKEINTRSGLTLCLDGNWKSCIHLWGWQTNTYSIYNWFYWHVYEEPLGALFRITSHIHTKPNPFTHTTQDHTHIQVKCFYF